MPVSEEKIFLLVNRAFPWKYKTTLLTFLPRAQLLRLYNSPQLLTKRRSLVQILIAKARFLCKLLARRGLSAACAKDKQCQEQLCANFWPSSSSSAAAAAAATTSSSSLSSNIRHIKIMNHGQSSEFYLFQESRLYPARPSDAFVQRKDISPQTKENRQNAKSMGLGEQRMDGGKIQIANPEPKSFKQRHNWVHEMRANIWLLSCVSVWCFCELWEC